MAIKLKYIAVVLVLIATLGSCKKCETCIGYHYANGVVGGVDNKIQKVKLCDKTQINAYESLTNFTDPSDTVRFICQ